MRVESTQITRLDRIINEGRKKVENIRRPGYRRRASGRHAEGIEKKSEVSRGMSEYGRMRTRRVSAVSEKCVKYDVKMTKMCLLPLQTRCN